MPKTAKAEKKRTARKTEPVVATTPAETVGLHVVGGTEASSETISLPTTGFKWAPTWMKVHVELTPEAAEKQEHPDQLPYPSKAALAFEAAQLIFQKKIKAKAEKGKATTLKVDVNLLDRLYESWQNRPVSKQEVRKALEDSRTTIEQIKNNDKYDRLDLTTANDKYDEAHAAFEAHSSRRDSTKLDWVEIKEMAEEAADLAHQAETDRMVALIRRRVARAEKAAQEITERNIEFRLGYSEGGKRNFELRELNKDLRALGWGLPEDR